jgi:UbiD family decarboxylase
LVFKDLRHFIDACQDIGELARITEEVDCDLEVGAITRRAFDLGGPAVLFEKLKGFAPNQHFFVNTFGTYRRYALALGLDPDTPVRDIVNTYYNRIKRPVKPLVVESGPCKENIQKGDEVNIDKFPTPKWNPGDGGRYIGTLCSCVTKDPDTGWVNVGMYRFMIHDKKSTGTLMLPMQHCGYHLSKYVAKKQAMPVALVIGVDPVISIASAGRYAFNVNEYEMAGALRQEPVELVRCETVDLEVPATAEIVLEGFVDPSTMKPEGPFGEYIGYTASGIQDRPVFNVTCVTHRNDAINTGTLEGKPLVEDHIIMSLGNAALSKKALIDDLGIPAVKDVFIHPWSPSNHLVVISTYGNPYPGHDKHVASALWGAKVGAGADWVLIVDQDIDPSNFNQVIWALCTRCKPDRGITIIQNAFDAMGLIPQGRTHEQIKKRIGLCKVLIDCRFPAEYDKKDIPPVSDFNEYPEELRNRVIQKFDKYLRHSGKEL